MKSRYAFHRQLDYMDCGPTCLKMVASYYGKEYSMDFMRAITGVSKEGVTLMGLCEAAESIGLKTLPVRVSLQEIQQQVPRPCILHWNQDHFVVLYAVKKNFWKAHPTFVVADPAHALVELSEEVFRETWQNSQEKGIALLMEPTAEFYSLSKGPQTPENSFSFLFQYLIPYRRYGLQVLLGIVFSSLLALLFPFLLQSLVDYGIQQRNYRFIHLVLFSQGLFLVGSLSVDFIRNWIVLHVSSRVSVSIITSFLTKLMKLPLRYYDSKNVGDIIQRIADHQRIESFLTGSSLQTLLALVNLVTFSVILGIYSRFILLLFGVGSLFTFLWILLFLKKRNQLDYHRFQRLREQQNSIYDLITGIHEIKLNIGERARRWEWENVQAKLFRVNIKALALQQYQEIGASLLTYAKNLTISYVIALAVIEQEFTLGIMFSISYVVGQMNSPILQLIHFLHSWQDAHMSVKRLSEIHARSDEETDQAIARHLKMEDEAAFTHSFYESSSLNSHLHQRSTSAPGIHLEQLSFHYENSKDRLALSRISMHIPPGKITAIVGASGSGKTTLLKLLLKFYEPTSGTIQVEGKRLKETSSQAWRKRCGVVFQDGYVFSDTIARNIAVDGQPIEEQRLMQAVKAANFLEVVEQTTMGFATKVGYGGLALSGGQKQRLLIARALYKNPAYLFFDEATSALDAENERQVLRNLETFFVDRTVVVIAHRLSTIQQADQIIVMHQGQIVQVGTHESLTAHTSGPYYELVKNQLQAPIPA